MVLPLTITVFLSGFAHSREVSERDSLEAVVNTITDDSAHFIALFNLGKLWRPDSLERANAYILQALEFSKKIGNKKGVAYCYSWLGVMELDRENYQGAANYFQQCLDHSYGVMSELEISSMVGNIGLMYETMGDYERALKHALKCLEIREELQDTVHLSFACFNVGKLHHLLGNRSEALAYHERALSLRKLIIDDPDEYNVIEDSYCAIAELHREGKEWDLALEFYNKALAIKGADKTTGDWSRPEILGNIGLVHQDRGQWDSAFFYFHQALDLNRNEKVAENSGTASTLLMIGQAHLLQGSAREALSSLLEANAMVEPLDLLPLRAEIASALAEAYEQEGQYEKALVFKNTFITLQDSIMSLEKVSSLQEMQTRYETERKEKEILELNSERKLAESEARQRSLLLWLFVAVLILVMIVALVIYRAYRQTKKLSVQLEQKNNEKAALLREIHHRVKNNLQVISSLLNLQSASLSDEAALDAIKEGQNRVKSIALIHQKLYQTEDISQVDFQEYAEQLAGFLSSAFRKPGKSVSIQVDADGIQLDIDTAVPLGLIINELVTNCFKYAFEHQDLGEVRIRMRKTDAGMLLSVKDNGVGLPKDLDISKSKSLGMKLVNILSRQLKGSVSWENEQGAKFVVRFQETAIRKNTA